MADKRKVYYIFDEKLGDATNKISNIRLRGAVIHSLIKSYRLLDKCSVSSSFTADESDLLSFHSATYIDYLKKAQQAPDLEIIAYQDETSSFNLEYDCPLFENIFDFACIIAGGTLSAVRLICPKKESEIPIETVKNEKPRSYLKFKDTSKLVDKSKVYDLVEEVVQSEPFLMESLAPTTLKVKEVVNKCKEKTEFKLPTLTSTQTVAMNWFGGWHHAQRDCAEGFCYVNDIVIGIQSLLKFYRRVLYLDLDVHHGNGVENAFAHTARVMTVSFHKYGAGYYPGTGALHDVGLGHGQYYSVNVPLRDGIKDGPYVSMFTQIMTKVKKMYNPDCIVVQCGADCLSGDPLGGFGLTLKSIGFCVKFMLDWRLPTVLLGGGGYDICNAARCYAYLTSIALGVKISNNIPENSFFHLFGPSFELDVSPSLRKDENSADYLKSILTTVLDHLEHIPIHS